VVEGVSPRYVVDQQRSSGAAVVRPGDALEAFLAGLYIRQNRAYRVPNLQLDHFAVNLDWARSELHSDGEVVLRSEPLVRELKQQTRFADA
jgi:hypothetical protein